jgi:HK97 family phage major capsid protein
MHGATVDRLKTVEGKIHTARETIAAMRKYDGNADAAEVAEKARHSLEVAEQEQAELLAKLSSETGTAGRGWELENLEEPRVKEALDHIAASGAAFNRLTLGEAISAKALAQQLGTVAKADVAVGPNARRGDFAGIATQPRRALTLLDLISTSTMDGATVPYLQETGSLDTAAETAEGATKPEGSAAYTDAQADAATIAHWLKFRKQSLADVDGLANAVDTRLRYGVLRRLENQIVIGDGVSPNIRGILATSGIQTLAFTAGPVADQLVRGAVRVFSAGGVANAALVNPADLEAALLSKTSGSGEYQGSPEFGGIFGLEWEARTIPSNAVPVGHAIVGDFATGATLFIREGVRVLISDSDGNDFTANRVTLLGEMRAALGVWQPSLFVDVDLAA